VIVDPATSILAVRAAAVLIALFGSGTTLVVAGQSFSQDEVTKGVSVVILGLTAIYGAVRTFRRGRLTPTSEHAIDLSDLHRSDLSPRLQQMVADIQRGATRG
jgi:hypothetical protein